MGILGTIFGIGAGAVGQAIAQKKQFKNERVLS